MRSYMAGYRARRKAFAIELLGGKCVVCGATNDLQFDHIEPSTKSMDISDMFGHTEQHLREELAKCQLLCQPHHIEKTLRDKGLQPGVIRHGTYRGWVKCRPRCEACKAYKREAQRQYRNNSA
jgi:hypothetical protein